ncbi:MAG: penicillin-binding protein 1A [Parvibaculum sp.]|uniref:penicillin-binding protein 1A n=1 Tax=Parvibaculum sp. TaxID=2024848 RepID=UPI0032ED6A52
MLKVLSIIAGIILVLFTGAVMAGGYYAWRLNQDLPDYTRLANYEPPVTTRVHAGDGQLIGELARERRLYVPISAIPPRLVEAFLAAEDKNFYTHGGVDATGIVRATIDNVFNVLQDRRLVGASTITQQVAKNFLLSSDVTFDRKLREALLALRLERAFTKDQILELYLNEIYLGSGSYGVAAAALNYFDKPLDELTVAEVAYLAALPKAPGNYHPFRFRERALARRNWVISRMAEERFITAYEAAEARGTDLDVSLRSRGVQTRDAEYFLEQVRRELLAQYGEQKLYEGGLSVRTTIDTALQEIASEALKNGLIAYDRRYGWRGPVATLEPGANWQEALAAMDVPSDLAPWTLATVLDVASDRVTVGLRPARLPGGGFEKEIVKSTIHFDDMKWARANINMIHLGPEVAKPSDVLKVGDIVYVAPYAEQKGRHTLQQVPAVNGAIVAMDPHTGRVLAMQGGFSFGLSEFNRAVQALRQPGSSFKPFVYAAALDKGFTPASLVLDAPFVIDQGPGLGLWKPENYERKFHGPSTMRFGLEHSRNLMTIRLAQYAGPETVADYARRYGIADNMMPVLSMSLGAGETTLMRLAGAYAVLANGGLKVEPTLVDRVQDRYGRTIYKHDTRACQVCTLDFVDAAEPPALPDNRERAEDARTAYQITSMLEGAIQRGTGASVKSVGVPLAGKTGTSNEARDTWFLGYSPNLVVGVFVGFDEPAPLGRAETGGRTAAPVFRDFMTKAIGGKPAIPFRIPSGINLVKVDLKTGALASGDGGGVILEAFREGTEPRLTSSTPMLGIAGGVLGSGAPGDAGDMGADISSDYLRGMEGDAPADTDGEAGYPSGPATSQGPVDPFALPDARRTEAPFAGMPADEAVELDRPGGVPLDSERDDPPADNRPPPPGGYAAGGRDIGSGTGGLY